MQNIFYTFLFYILQNLLLVPFIFSLLAAIAKALVSHRIIFWLTFGIQEHDEHIVASWVHQYCLVAFLAAGKVAHLFTLACYLSREVHILMAALSKPFGNHAFFQCKGHKHQHLEIIVQKLTKHCQCSKCAQSKECVCHTPPPNCAILLARVWFMIIPFVLQL